VIKPYNCRNCGFLDAPQFLFIKWGYNIYRCIHCGTGFTEIGTDFNPKNFYDEEYFQGGQKDGYADYAGSQKILRKEFNKLVSKLLEYSLPGGKLLEIGCAYGFFLSEASAFYDCIGVEVSKEAAKYAVDIGSKVYNQCIDENLIKKIGPFDVVVMLDVIEHLVNPVAIIQLISENIKQNGILLITTGDFSSLYSKISGKRWRLMTPPQHLHFFTKKGLISLIERNRFKLVSAKYQWKYVPGGLILYQITRRMGWRLKWIRRFHAFGIPVNLFDTLTIIAKKVS